jgi:transposase
MPEDAPRPAQAAIRTDLGAIFVSLELSRRAWLVTSLSPGGGEKMSKHSVQAGDIAGLLRRFAQLKEKARARTGRDFPVITIQEAGLDGFWIHRVLQSEGIRAGDGGRRPTRSTARRWCARCWPTSAANRGCVPW